MEGKGEENQEKAAYEKKVGETGNRKKVSGTGDRKKVSGTGNGKKVSGAGDRNKASGTGMGRRCQGWGIRVEERGRHRKKVAGTDMASLMSPVYLWYTWNSHGSGVTASLRNATNFPVNICRRTELVKLLARHPLLQGCHLANLFLVFCSQTLFKPRFLPPAFLC